MVKFLKQIVFEAEVVFKQTVEFFSKVTFHDRVTFADQDMGGYAVIKPGDTRVHVNFENPYEQAPIVSVTIVGQEMEYYVDNILQDGFDIVITQSSEQDITFTWVAMAVQDPGTVYSDGVADQASVPNQDQTATPSTDIDSSAPTSQGTERG